MDAFFPSRKTCEHFFQYLDFHPGVRAKRDVGETPEIVLIADKVYYPLATYLARELGDGPSLQISAYAFDELSRDALIGKLDGATAFVLLYQSFGRTRIDPEGAVVTRSIKEYLKTHWKRSVLLLDVNESFDEIYGTPPSEISRTNDAFIAAASVARELTIDDKRGGQLAIDLSDGRAWTNVDGFTTNDLIPGEVATRAKTIDGKIRFSGTFLGTIPFAIKYGMVQSTVQLEVKAGKVVSLTSDSPAMDRDFENHFRHNEGNRSIDEVGIGTNPSVKLHAYNSAFEERHCGLHLGLGGVTPGSHHLDLLFDNVDLYLDGKKVFDCGTGAFLL